MKRCSCKHLSNLHVWSLRYLAYVCIWCTCIHDDSLEDSCSSR